MEDHGQTLNADAVLQWFDQHGRHDLPWQHNPTPYRVWVSEIMLQQTQVTTVIAYYQRFMQHFPDIHALAQAPIDDVLHLWTGLGYYARARNLHKTARIVSSQYHGDFPVSLEQLSELPGIGRSTAGAILALSMGQRGVILDGNVKRVLCRYYAIQSWSGENATQKLLWQLAEVSTPHDRTDAYTQAMMDLGATVCTRSKPACTRCPLADRCQALEKELTKTLPVSKPRKILPVRQTFMVLCAQDSHEVLLELRPDSGLWGGLWSFPEFSTFDDVQTWLEHKGARFETCWPVARHTFSHFHLDITPVVAKLTRHQIAESAAGICWYPLTPAENDARTRLGLSAPVKKMLLRLAAHQENHHESYRLL
ncbi:MAG: A/G-specific adenine glycosylase [Gammaproteobacteria bacterium]|nr:A/G-specific adenine glycosylase [Gammaproteobacteria bacterium]